MSVTHLRLARLEKHELAVTAQQFVFVSNAERDLDDATFRKIVRRHPRPTDMIVVIRRFGNTEDDSFWLLKNE